MHHTFDECRVTTPNLSLEDEEVFLTWRMLQQLSALSKSGGTSRSPLGCLTFNKSVLNPQKGMVERRRFGGKLAKGEKSWNIHVSDWFLLEDRFSFIFSHMIRPSVYFLLS